MSAQKQESVPASDEGLVGPASHIGLTLLQGGLSPSSPMLGEMPTPKTEAPYQPPAGHEYELPPAKFINPAHLGRATIFAY